MKQLNILNIINDITFRLNRNIHLLFVSPVTNQEILPVVENLQLKSSCGFDGISCKILKIIAPAVIDPLCKIINKSFSQGVFL